MGAHEISWIKYCIINLLHGKCITFKSVKGRVLLVHATEAYRGGEDVYLHSFITLTLLGNMWLTSALAALLPGKQPWYHRIGGWVGPKAGLDILYKRIISCLYQDSNSGPI
jgi:hypothetical protein